MKLTSTVNVIDPCYEEFHSQNVLDSKDNQLSEAMRLYKADPFRKTADDEMYKVLLSMHYSYEFKTRLVTQAIFRQYQFEIMSKRDEPNTKRNLIPELEYLQDCYCLMFPDPSRRRIERDVAFYQDFWHYWTIFFELGVAKLVDQRFVRSATDVQTLLLDSLDKIEDNLGNQDNQDTLGFSYIANSDVGYTYGSESTIAGGAYDRESKTTSIFQDTTPLDNCKGMMIFTSTPRRPSRSNGFTSIDPNIMSPNRPQTARRKYAYI